MEHIPWISNAPVVFGRKSREEIDRQNMSMFRKLRSRRTSYRYD
jgi:hypothetical protein